MRVKVSAFDAAMSSPWAIIPENLESILTITHRHMNGDQVDIEAVAAKIGRPLENTRNVEVRDGVAVIPVSGPIFRFASMFTRISGATSVEDLSTDFAEAMDNPDVKSILFDVDSPGGQVAGVEEFAKMIYDARGKKPMATYSGDLMASAALWIGSATEKVYAAPTARIGSIGVIAAFDDYRDAKNKMGVREFKFVSSKSPRKQPDPATKQGASDIQSVVDDIATIFISDMARNRGVSVESVEEDFGQGSVMISAKAVEAGLIDGISSLEIVIDSMSNGLEVEIKSHNTARVSEGVEARENQNKEKSQMSKETEKEVTATAPVIDRDYLNANHAEIVSSIKAEGADAERQRFKDIEAAAIPGHESIVHAAKYENDGKTTASDMALQILGAEKEIRKGSLQSIESNAPAPVEQVDSAESHESKGATNIKSDMSDDEKIQAEWNALDQDFKDVYVGGESSFKDVRKKEIKGQIKIRNNRD